MKRLTLTAALVASALLGASRAGAQSRTIDFNAGFDGQQIGAAYYLSFGVTFLNAAWYSGTYTNEDAVDAQGGLKLVDGRVDRFLPIATDPIVAIFEQAISSASIVGLDIGDAGVQFRAYDAPSGGNLVVSSDAIFGTGIGDGNNGTLSLSGSSIRRLEFYRPNDTQDGVAFDNLTFTPQVTATPEPASLVLCATGLVGLAGWSRRQRKRKLDAS